MRIFLIILLSTFCFSASAQWYRVDKLLKKHERPEAIEPMANHSAALLPVATLHPAPAIITQALASTEYSYLAQESRVMKTAQHNMRFRVYADASYNFSDLARLYIKQNRYAEAKWYLLQSNLISRSQNDDKHTIANLIDLATIKAGLGDYVQALQDLTEAHDLACLRDFKEEEAAIDKKILYLKQTPKVDVRYAEEPQGTPKAG
jgi:hypothetical protein